MCIYVAMHIVCYIIVRTMFSALTNLMKDSFTEQLTAEGQEG